MPATMINALKNSLKLAILGVSILLATAVQAEARSCSDMTNDLRAMQKAQTALLESMVRKNESMASTLDQYAQTFNSKKTVRKADVVGMKKSAVAFRNHQGREQKLVQRFSDKTDELISQVEQCLKSKTIAAQ